MWITRGKCYFSFIFMRKGKHPSFCLVYFKAIIIILLFLSTRLNLKKNIFIRRICFCVLMLTLKSYLVIITILFENLNQTCLTFWNIKVHRNIVINRYLDVCCLFYCFLLLFFFSSKLPCELYCKTSRFFFIINRGLA